MTMIVKTTFQKIPIGDKFRFLGDGPFHRRWLYCKSGASSAYFAGGTAGSISPDFPVYWTNEPLMAPRPQAEESHELGEVWMEA